MKTPSTIRLLGITVLATVIVALLIFGPRQSYLTELLAWIQGSGVWGPLLLAVVYILATVLFVPGSLLTLGAGFVFGLAIGTITVSLASTLGAAAAFLLGRTLARPWIQQKVERMPRFRALDEAVKRQGFKIVLLVRLCPVFPFNLLNYAFGLTAVSFRDYLLASWIGMLPATVVYVYLGSTLKSLADLATGKIEGRAAQRIWFGIGLVATIMVTILVTRLARRALQEAVGMPEAKQPDGRIPG